MRDDYGSIAEGDTVLVYSGGSWGSTKLDKVARLTKTQLVVDGGSRFSRRDGCQVGGYGRASLRIATPDRLAEHYDSETRRRCIAVVRGHNPERLTTSQLDRIASIIAQPKP